MSSPKSRLKGPVGRFKSYRRASVYAARKGGRVQASMLPCGYLGLPKLEQS